MNDPVVTVKSAVTTGPSCCITPGSPETPALKLRSTLTPVETPAANPEQSTTLYSASNSLSLGYTVSYKTVTYPCSHSTSCNENGYVVSTIPVTVPVVPTSVQSVPTTVVTSVQVKAAPSESSEVEVTSVSIGPSYIVSYTVVTYPCSHSTSCNENGYILSTIPVTIRPLESPSTPVSPAQTEGPTSTPLGEEFPSVHFHWSSWY